MTEAERVEQIYHNSSPDMLTPEGWQFLFKMARIGASVMPRPISEMPPRHEDCLFLTDKGRIFDGRPCYGMHEPWWCANTVDHETKVLNDYNINVIGWIPKSALPKPQVKP